MTSMSTSASFDSIDAVSTPTSFAYSEDSSDTSFDENDYNRAKPNEDVQGYTVFGTELELREKKPGEDIERFMELQKDSDKLFKEFRDEKTGKLLKLSDEDYAKLNDLIERNKPFSGLDVRDQPHLKFVGRTFPTALKSDVVGGKKAFTRLQEYRLSLKYREQMRNGTFVSRAEQIKRLKQNRLKTKDPWILQKKFDPSSLEYLSIKPMALPDTALSYNAPDEFETEHVNYMREIQPNYKDLFIERINRQIDLYLAPRSLQPRNVLSKQQMIEKYQADVNKLRPFPTFLDMTVRGAIGAVNALDISPNCRYVAAGGMDGVLRIYELLTGKLIKQYIMDSEFLHGEEVDKYYRYQINSVKFCPRKDVALLAVAVAKQIIFIDVNLSFGLSLDETRRNTRKMVNFDVSKAREKAIKNWAWEGFQGTVNAVDDEILEAAAKESEKYQQFLESVKDLPQDDVASRESALQELDPRLPLMRFENTHQNLPDRVSLYSSLNAEIVLKITSNEIINQLSFHAKGDYLLSISNINETASNLAIHKISAGQTIQPFTKAHPVQAACFYPSQARILVCEQATAFSYNLKTLSTDGHFEGCGSQISACCIGAENHIIMTHRNGAISLFLHGGSGLHSDKNSFFRVPVNTCAITDTGLVACGGADGVIQILRIWEGQLAPCCVLRGHGIKNQIGVCSCQWAGGCLVSSAGDTTLKIWR